MTDPLLPLDVADELVDRLVMLRPHLNGGTPQQLLALNITLTAINRCLDLAQEGKQVTVGRWLTVLQQLRLLMERSGVPYQPRQQPGTGQSG